MPSNQFGQDLEEDLGYDLGDNYEPPEDEDEYTEEDDIETDD